jgi:hypothetical protein
VAFFQPLDGNERWEELQEHPEWHFGRPASWNGTPIPSSSVLTWANTRRICAMWMPV